MADRFRIRLSEDLVSAVRREPESARVAPDVSVLLAGILDIGSYSNQALSILAGRTVVLGEHVERIAREVLRWNAPDLLGDLGDGLLQLAQHSDVVRVGPTAPSVLPQGANTLSGEDRQVLADAIGGEATLLLTHDSKFFSSGGAALRVESPSSYLWSPGDPRNVEFRPDAWTFLGLFWPSWSSDAVRGMEGEEFYVMDLPGTARFFYEGRRSAFVLQWPVNDGWADVLVMPHEVEFMATNFAAVTADSSGVAAFVNGQTSEASHCLPVYRHRAKLSPFNSSSGEGQINGGMRFRMASCRYSVRHLRRLWKSTSLHLSDGEIRFQDHLSTVQRRLALLRRRPGAI